MIVEEFSEDSETDFKEFGYGQPLVTKQGYTKLPWIIRRLHECYYLACVCGLEFIEGHIPEALFKSQTFDLNVKLFKLHTIY
jgi:hypothetical protein